MRFGTYAQTRNNSLAPANTTAEPAKHARMQSVISFARVDSRVRLLRYSRMLIKYINFQFCVCTSLSLYVTINNEPVVMLQTNQFSPWTLSPFAIPGHLCVLNNAVLECLQKWTVNGIKDCTATPYNIVRLLWCMQHTIAKTDVVFSKALIVWSWLLAYTIYASGGFFHTALHLLSIYMYM